MRRFTAGVSRDRLPTSRKRREKWGTRPEMVTRLLRYRALLSCHWLTGTQGDSSGEYGAFLVRSNSQLATQISDTFSHS